MKRDEIEDEDYDVVLATIESKINQLWKMTESNMNMGIMNIMDDIRIESIEQLKEAAELWKNREKYYDYEFRYESVSK